MRTALAFTLIAALSACGGGGGGGSNTSPAGVTFTGTVAIGDPLVGKTISVMHADGVTGYGVTDAAGRYSVTLTGTPAGARPLYFVMTEDTPPPSAGPASPAPFAYPRLVSIANRHGGTVNVTPLTNLVVAWLLGERQGNFPNLRRVRSMATLTDAAIASARQEVVTYLQSRSPPVNASALGDFITTSFQAVAGDPHDDAIERLAQTFVPGETIAGVEEHFLARNDPSATLREILSLELDAECTVQGNPTLPIPSGRVHISLRPTGEITIGTYTHLIAAGESVTITSAPFFDDRWRFTFANNEQLEIWEIGKVLSTIVLIRGSGSTICAPATEIALGARTPSTLGQVRALNAAITNTTFNCPVGLPDFPGVNTGANVLDIDANGALRVNPLDPAGYRLHLPSLGLSMSASFVRPGGILGTEITGAAFTRAFAGGFDAFSIEVNGGVIQRVQFGQQRNNAPSENKICS